MMRPAVPGDAVAIEAFLARHAATSMFLRGNLAAFGLGNTVHPFATTFHIFPSTGPIRAVFGRTNSGMVLCQCPDDLPALGAYAQALAPHPLTGFTGDAGQIDALTAALGLGAADFGVNHLEPLFRLALAALPGGPGMIRPPRPEELGLLTGWFQDYMADTGLAFNATEAQDRATSAVRGNAVRLLDGPDGPVAMAALNAQAGDWVQVGGVFVPAPLRGKGLGREVTRALLAEARANGAQQAVLFANNDAAARAYRAIGFRQVGWYRIAFLEVAR